MFERIKYPKCITLIQVSIAILIQLHILKSSRCEQYNNASCKGAHCLSSVAGSAAQEAIKIITHQFVPFNNTFLYNAMSQTSATFQL